MDKFTYECIFNEEKRENILIKYVIIMNIYIHKLLISLNSTILYIYN